VETTVNDVSFFKHHRKVEHKGGPATRELAPLKKSIYSLIDLREILRGCNQRYLAFLCVLAGACPTSRPLTFVARYLCSLPLVARSAIAQVRGWQPACIYRNGVPSCL
jgi:hypothetical protein